MTRRLENTKNEHGKILNLLRLLGREVVTTLVESEKCLLPVESEWIRR